MRVAKDWGLTERACAAQRPGSLCLAVRLGAIDCKPEPMGEQIVGVLVGGRGGRCCRKLFTGLCSDEYCSFLHVPGKRGSPGFTEARLVGVFVEIALNLAFGWDHDDFPVRTNVLGNLRAQFDTQRRPANIFGRRGVVRFETTEEEKLPDD